MTSLGQEAGQWLNASATEVASMLTERHFERHPELDKRYGDIGRKKCLEDGLYHVQYLEQAVCTGQPRLFTDYVIWARVLLKNLSIPGSDLRANLEVLAGCIRELAPPALVTVITEPLDDVLSRYDSLADDVPSFIRPDNPQAGLAKRYLDLLLVAKRREASALILEAVDAGTTIRDIYLNVFQPTQYEIGRLWQTNQVSVAQEHFCTAATQMVMSQLYPRLFSAQRNGKKLVSACVSGDLHEIGTRIVTDLFEMDGWDTFYIGANTPDDSLVKTVCDENADLVALSATMVAHIPRIVAAIERVRSAAPKVPIMVGGYPFLQAPELCAEVGADATAANGGDAVRLGRELVEARTS